MPTVDPLVLRLQADLAQYNRRVEASTALVDRSLKRQEDAVSRLEYQMTQSSAGIASGLGAIGAAAAGVSIVALARQFLTYADAAKQIEAQLRLATQAFGTFGQAQADVERLSQTTRSGLAETASLYGNMVRATQALGGSQADAARATETFSKALKIGGADANAAASATLQFGQALASGVLRGDEFNSITEASPRLLRLIADAMGVTQGALRKLAEEGKLTADVLQRALTDRKFTAAIDEEFRSLPVTFDDAMTQVKNAAIVTFGAFDRGGEFSTALATFVTDGSNGFKSLGQDAEQLGIDIRSTLTGLSDVFDPMLGGAQSVFSAILSDSRSVADQIRGDITNVLSLYDRLQNVGADSERSIRQGANALVRGGVLRRDWYFTPETGMPQRSDVAGSFQRSADRDRRDRENRARIRRASLQLERNGYVVPRNADGSVDAANIRRRVNPKAQPKPVDDAAAKKAEAARKKAEREAAAAARKAETERQRELRNDEAYANEKAALNQDILRARQSIATAAETVAQFELQEIEAARTRQNAAYQTDVAQKRLTQARANELIALNDKVAVERAAVVNAREAERKRTEAAAIREGDLSNARDIASAEAQLAVTAADRRAAALRLLDLEYQMERARLDAIVASQASTEAEREIARRRLASLGQLQEIDRQGVERQNEGSLKRFRRGLDDPATDIEDAVAQKLQDVDDAIADAAAKTLGIKDPFLRRLLQIFLEQNVLKPLYDAASGSGGGGTLGSLIKAGAALFGRASGGYVGPGQTVRVNEGRGSGVELLRMGSQGGTVIPLGQAKASARPTQTVVHQHFSLDARGGLLLPEFVANIQSYVDGQAARAGATSYQSAIRDTPAAEARRGSLKA